MSMWKECEGLQGELVKMRRELHQIPEFGLDLPETQKYVTDKLDELGIPYKCSGTDRNQRRKARQDGCTSCRYGCT